MNEWWFLWDSMKGRRNLSIVGVSWLFWILLVEFIKRNNWFRIFYFGFKVWLEI